MNILRIPCLLLALAGASSASAQSLELWHSEMEAAKANAAKAVRANPDRSYPPSCLSYPFSNTTRGTADTRRVTIGDIDNPQAYSEQVDMTVWRVACSGGRSAVMVKFTRPANRAGTLPAPDVPAPFASQSGIQNRALRLHVEPNTYFSEVITHSIVGEVTLVLETIPTLPFDLNAAFTLTLVTFVNNQQQLLQVPVPAYNASTHPDGSQVMEITGYHSGSYFDATRPGEGANIEVGERPNGTRYIAAIWYTYDPQGNPAWLVGNAELPAGARGITIPALYVRGGGFAGNFNPSNVSAVPWGSFTVGFPNCNNLILQHDATHNIANAPNADGTRNWVRSGSMNGFACE